MDNQTSCREIGSLTELSERGHLKKSLFSLKTLIVSGLLILSFIALIFYWFTSARKDEAALLQNQQPDYGRARASISDLKLINYYPKNNPKAKMWANWDAAVVDSDFARIASLHANAVRVAVVTEPFGFPNPSQAMLERLEQLLSLAAKHNLRVQLTLGIFVKPESVDDIKKYTSALLSRYRNDPRIAFIDIQNEMNSSDARLIAAASLIVPYVRGLVGDIPLTISVSGSSGINGLRQLKDSGIPLDFYSLHYYGRQELAYYTFQQAQKITAPTPLFIGETGASTLPSKRPEDKIYDQAWWDAAQDQYHRTVQFAAKAAGLPPAAIWVYSDFSVDAFQQRVEPAEYYFGLFRADGTEKPAALSIGKIFGGSGVDASFNNGFESGSSLPANWRLWRPANASFARDTSVRHSGSASARISRSLDAGSDSPGFYRSPVKFIVPGQSYNASAWVKAENATGVTRVALAWYNASGKYISTSASSNLRNGNTEWTQLSVKAQAPPDAAIVEIHLESKGNTGTVWFDDVTFE